MSSYRESDSDATQLIDGFTPLVEEDLARSFKQTKRQLYCFGGILLFILLGLAIFCVGAFTFYFTHMQPPSIQTIRILHFSDFYQVEGVPKFQGDNQLLLGGMSRLATIIKQQSVPYLLLFGGDLFFPSAMSTAFGAPDQMVETFNKVGVHAAVAGNHEFDRGLSFAQTQFPRFNFPWLLSNFHKPNTTQTLDGLRSTFTTTLNGIKIGIFGLGFDYRETSNLQKDVADYQDYVTNAYNTAKQLRADGCQLIIALIHIQWVHQAELIYGVPEIDLILSGHDHFWRYERINDVDMVEGDTDLRRLTVIDIAYYPGSSPLLKKDKVTFMIPDDTIPKDPEMEVIVQKYVERFKEKSQGNAGSTSTVLDCKDEHVRTRETNLGNYVADVVRNWAVEFIPTLPELPKGIDLTTPIISYMNGGALRWNSEKGPGNITVADVLGLSPFGSVMCIIITSGQQLRDALEHGVELLPNPAGWFPQISGFKVVHTCPSTCSRPVGHRIVNMTINGTPIESNTTLVMVVSDFIAGGGDGYSQFVNDYQIVTKANGPDFTELFKLALQKESPIHPVVEGRIIGINDTIITNEILN